MVGSSSRPMLADPIDELPLGILREISRPRVINGARRILDLEEPLSLDCQVEGVAGLLQRALREVALRALQAAAGAGRDARRRIGPAAVLGARKFLLAIEEVLEVGPIGLESRWSPRSPDYWRSRRAWPASSSCRCRPCKVLECSWLSFVGLGDRIIRSNQALRTRSIRLWSISLWVFITLTLASRIREVSIIVVISVVGCTAAISR